MFVTERIQYCKRKTHENLRNYVEKRRKCEEGKLPTAHLPKNYFFKNCNHSSKPHVNNIKICKWIWRKKHLGYKNDIHKVNFLYAEKVLNKNLI